MWYLRNILLLGFLAITIVKAQTDSLQWLYKQSIQTFKRNELDSSELLSKKLINVAIKKKSITFQLLGMDVLANVYTEKKDYKNAFSQQYAIVNLCTHDSLARKKARAYNNLGALHFEQKQFTEALDFFKKEIVLREKIADSLRLANNYINLSSVYRNLNLPDSVRFFIEKSGIIAKKLKKELVLANYYNVLGNYFFTTYQNTNKASFLDSATLYYNKANEIWERKKDIRNQLKAITNLGYVHQTKKDFKNAIHYFKLAENVADSLNYPEAKSVIYGNLAETHYDLKQYKDASEYFKKLIQVKDSLQKTELKNYAVELNKKFQLENKSRTILEQSLELEQKNNRIANQQKQIYLYVLIIVLVLIITGIVLVYFNFNKKLHKKIEEAKEKFFINIMHEIKTPLSMIQAPLKTLKPKLKNEEDIYYLNLAEKNTHRLNELLTQMLDLSKIDSGSYKLKITIGSPKQTILELTDSFQKSALEKNIQLLTEINFPDGNFDFDKDALEKILSNLISNAIKYTPNGGLVGVIISSEEQENTFILNLEVWDSGHGIPKSDQEKLFTRFYRGKQAFSSEKGIGVGLSMVKEIVQACRGKIWFTSEEGKGSRFGVSLPLKLSSANITNTIVSVRETEKPLVLIIEDDQDISGFLINYLSSKKYETVHAANGKLALQVLKNTVPDIIVTDLMMDEMDGLTFIKETRNNKGLSHIPLIVLSAKANPQSRIDCLNAGAQAFITKPFIPEELFSIIENQLNLIDQLKKETKKNLNESHLRPEEKFKSKDPYCQKLFNLIFEQFENPNLNVEYLADLMATNRSHFQRKVKTLSGYSPSEIIKMVRLEKAMEFLKDKKGNVTEVAYMCGFSSQSYFTKCFSEYFGFSPSSVS